MLKKTIIAAAIAGAAFMALAGGANAGTSNGLKAPFAHHAGKATPHKFKIAGKRKFGHHRRFRHWDSWHYRPHRNCHWLKRKARWTGKYYWWKRYNLCRSYYYR